MTLVIPTIQPYVLGPLENNTIILADPKTGEAAIVDPAFDSASLLKDILSNDWKISQIWLTHAHFDHAAGIHELLPNLAGSPRILLHPGDLALYQKRGGAMSFGVQIESFPPAEAILKHGQILSLGECKFEVRHAPGHTPGHVIFYSAAAGTALTGDVIFFRGIGRTDFPGGNYAELINSIRTQVFSLPAGTKLISGHGLDTRVADEMKYNPFLND